MTLTPEKADRSCLVPKLKSLRRTRSFQKLIYTITSFQHSGLGLGRAVETKSFTRAIADLHAKLGDGVDYAAMQNDVTEICHKRLNNKILIGLGYGGMVAGKILGISDKQGQVFGFTEKPVARILIVFYINHSNTCFRVRMNDVAQSHLVQISNRGETK